MLQEDADQVFQIAQAWLAVDQRHHVHAERVLQLRLLVQVVQYHFGHFAALELNDEAHARLVGFVLNVADALDFLLVHQFGHAFLQRLLVDLVGQLINDDGLSLAAVDVLKMALGAHDHAAPPGAVAVLDAVDAVDDAGRGEVRCRDDLHQLIDGGIRMVQQVQAGVHHFVQVVGRDIGGHAHGDTRRSIDQQIGQLAGQHDGLFQAAVVVRTKIHRLFVDVGQHFVGDLVQADFRIPHGRRVVAIDRSEIALAINQRVTQAERLGHSHDRVVNG